MQVFSAKSKRTQLETTNAESGTELTFVIPVRALLQANVQINQSNMTRRTSKAVFQRRPCASFTGSIAWLTDVLAISVTPRWTCTNASPKDNFCYNNQQPSNNYYLLIHPLIFTSNALIRCSTKAPLLVTLLITAFPRFLVIINRVVIITYFLPI